MKAANVLIIGEFDAVKLCDFGVTVPLQKDGTTDPTCQYVGTEPWSAPEVIEEEEITDKADIFALGKQALGTKIDDDAFYSADKIETSTKFPFLRIINIAKCSYSFIGNIQKWFAIFDFLGYLGLIWPQL